MVGAAGALAGPTDHGQVELALRAAIDLDVAVSQLALGAALTQRTYRHA